MRAVNLIPTDQRGGAAVGAGRSEGAVYGVIGLIAGLAVLALLYGLAHHQVTSRRAQAATVVAEAQQAHAAAEQLAPYTSFVALREQREQAVASLVDARFDWAHAFHEFGRVLPSDVSIASLGGTVGSSTGTTVVAPTATGAASSVTSATPPGSVPTFTLSGCATSQPVVAETIERLRLIDGAHEVTLQSSTSSGSSSTSSGGGSCGGDSTSFSAQVTFDPLPASTVAAAAAKTVADPTSTAPSQRKHTTSKGAAR
jgi:hypothetical protein